jgi:hypothetical protein
MDNLRIGPGSRPARGQRTGADRTSIARRKRLSATTARPRRRPASGGEQRCWQSLAWRSPAGRTLLLPFDEPTGIQPSIIEEDRRDARGPAREVNTWLSRSRVEQNEFVAAVSQRVLVIKRG